MWVLRDLLVASLLLSSTFRSWHLIVLELLYLYCGQGMRKIGLEPMNKLAPSSRPSSSPRTSDVSSIDLQYAAYSISIVIFISWLESIKFQTINCLSRLISKITPATEVDSMCHNLSSSVNAVYLTSLAAMTKNSPRGSNSSSCISSARELFNFFISVSILGNWALRNVFLSDSREGSFNFFWASVCSFVRLWMWTCGIDNVRLLWVGAYGKIEKTSIVRWNHRSRTRLLLLGDDIASPEIFFELPLLPIKGLGLHHQSTLQSYESCFSVIHCCKFLL